MTKNSCRTLWGVLIIFMTFSAHEAMSMEKSGHEDLKEELFRAIEAHDKQAVINALNKGADKYINQIYTELDVTPLMVAIKEDDPDMVDLLLNKGADPKIVNRHGQSALFSALLKKYSLDSNETPKPLKHAARIVHALITHGAGVNKQNSIGEVPLRIALDLEDSTLKYTIVADLIKHGATNIANYDNKTPFGRELETVTMQNEPDLRVLGLLTKIAPMSLVKMAFDGAIQLENVQIARLFMEQKGVPIDELDQRGKTRLIYYMLPLDINTIRVLIQLGANVNQADIRGNMPLYYAVQSEDPSLADLLLSRGALVNVHNEQGYTALHEAVRAGNDNDVVKRLLQVPTIRPDETDHHGLTPLHLAARENKYSMVIALLGHASVDARDDHGNTPLILAVINGASLSVVQALLRAGADVKQKNYVGQSALSLRNGPNVNPEVHQLLLKAPGPRD